MNVGRALSVGALFALLLLATGPLHAQEGGADESGGVGSADRPPEPRRVDYDLQLREVEDRLNDLKERVQRAKARLFALREEVLQERIGATRMVLALEDKLSNRFEIAVVRVFLDGNQIYTATNDSGAPVEIGERSEVLAESALPGPHNLMVEVVLRGNGYGVFAYMADYRFTVRAPFAFNVEEGETIEVDVIFYERGGFNRPIEERPNVRFETRSYPTQPDDETVASGEESSP